MLPFPPFTSAAESGLAERARQIPRRQNKGTANLVKNDLKVIIKPKQNLRKELNTIHHKRIL